MERIRRLHVRAEPIEQNMLRICRVPRLMSGRNDAAKSRLAHYGTM